jgi:hypothetical protein
LPEAVDVQIGSQKVAALRSCHCRVAAIRRWCAARKFITSAVRQAETTAAKSRRYPI